MEFSQCEFLHNLGKEICNARKRLHMSQDELAEKADLSLTYIGKIECGHKNIFNLSKLNVAKRLGEPPAEVEKNTDIPTPSWRIG